MRGDLTTLAAVRTWLSIDASNTGVNSLLSSLITQISRSFLNFMERGSLLSANYVRYLDGSGSTRQLLPDWPVTAISKVAIDGVEIAAATRAAPTRGYLLEPWDNYLPGYPQTLDLRGYIFCDGQQNVEVDYTAGYLITGESHTVAAGVVQVDAPQGNWGADGGVTYANGTALVAVASAPAVGQYALDPTTVGKYLFNATDTGQTVLISYSFIPSDLEELCLEQIAERYNYKSRVGERSKTLGGQETVVYELSSMSAFVKASLQPYCRTLPI